MKIQVLAQAYNQYAVQIPLQRGRGTFGLENSSGVKEQPIFSLPHQLQGQGPDPSPHDNHAKLCQAATSKECIVGDN